ncbi:hypothetical protein CDAR_598651 [Caerostris darwini]|uniref:Uncharacterized protein n=1 Tax=Caerostris darwini TaxID=1538125 RepID=A0AAV4VXI5_9ARAC|nr:hypothetical protein CDAR_598651 [Caerostris darwini]
METQFILFPTVKYGTASTKSKLLIGRACQLLARQSRLMMQPTARDPAKFHVNTNQGRLSPHLFGCITTQTFLISSPRGSPISSDGPVTTPKLICQCRGRRDVVITCCEHVPIGVRGRHRVMSPPPPLWGDSGVSGIVQMVIALWPITNIP